MCSKRTFLRRCLSRWRSLSSGVCVGLYAYESLLLEDVDVEAHFDLVEELGEGSHESAEETLGHEVVVVDWMVVELRLRCS